MKKHKFKTDDISSCSKNGCELVDSFLEQTVDENLEDEIRELQEKINKKENTIDELTNFLLSLREDIILLNNILNNKKELVNMNENPIEYFLNIN